jgi:hypothetical protein
MANEMLESDETKAARTRLRNMLEQSVGVPSPNEPMFTNGYAAMVLSDAIEAYVESKIADAFNELSDRIEARIEAKRTAENG